MKREELREVLTRAQAEHWPVERMESLIDQIMKGESKEADPGKLKIPDSASPETQTYAEKAAHAPEDKDFHPNTKALEARPNTQGTSNPKTMVPNPLPDEAEHAGKLMLPKEDKPTPPSTNPPSNPNEKPVVDSGAWAKKKDK